MSVGKNKIVYQFAIKQRKISKKDDHPSAI